MGQGLAPLAVVPLFGRGFASKSPSVTTAKLINGYRDRVLEEDKTPLPFYGTPGLTLQYDVGAVIRGGVVVNQPALGGQFAYVVAGNTFFAINPAGAVVNGGVIATSTGPVYFAWNGTQLMFVDGMKGYVFVPGVSPLAQITDVDFPTVATGGPSWCTWLGGYFVVGLTNKAKFQFSAVNDCTAWNPLDFATAETIPDNCLRGEAAGGGGELVLFGERSIEFWGLSGDANIMRRIGSSALEWGIVSPQTVARFKDGFAFLAQNQSGEVQAGELAGHDFQSFTDTDPDVADDINNRTYASLQAGTAFSYFLDSHWFYQLNFADKSYLFDLTTQSWSQLTSGVPFLSRHYANIRLGISYKPYVCDYRNGRIYLLDKTNFTDNGDTQIFQLYTKHVFNAGNPITINEFVIEIEAGDGLNTGQGSDPQIMLSWSKDGGRTWGNEIWSSMGMMGLYRARAVWRNLGRARDWAFRCSISDPIPRKIVTATVDLEP